MNRHYLPALFTLTLMLTASDVRAEAPTLYVQDGNLTRVSWKVLIRRATSALEAEGFTSVTAGGSGPESKTEFVGGKHPIYSVSIMCRPQGTNGSTYTVVVASNSGDARAMRDRLVSELTGVTPGGADAAITAAEAKAFAGGWYEDSGRPLTIQVDGVNLTGQDPNVQGTFSGTITRDEEGVPVFRGRYRNQFGTGDLVMRIVGDGDRFIGTWTIDVKPAGFASSSGGWNGTRAR